MSISSEQFYSRVQKSRLYQAVAEFSRPSRRAALGQILNTLIPYLALWGGMAYLVLREVNYLLVLLLALLAAAFQVRLFIIFHDCCHGSFYASPRWNRILGYITGILTFTPFEHWRHSHNVHHATVGDLDRRGKGDVYTMTVEEFQAASAWVRFGYRLFRHPIIMFGLGPVFVFLIRQRFWSKDDRRPERNSVIYTNLAILGLLVAAHFTIGLRTFALVQLPITLIAGAAGVWLFYVQHQFEGVYWARRADWEPLRAALEGSSYYQLPRLLQWFSGNIGLHHIHHVQPRIPNYNLQRAQDNIPAFQSIQPLTLGRSLRSLWMNLWDEQAGRLVGFRALKFADQPQRNGN